MSRSLPWLPWLALLGCARPPAVVVARREVSPTARPAARPAASVARPPPEALRAPCVPIGRGADGRRYATCGGLRASIGDDGAALAAQRFESIIERAVPVARGWAFVTVDGAVLAAEEFLGPTRAVGHVPSPAREVLQSEGRLVIRKGTELFATDGASPLAPAPAPPTAVSLAFVDARRGAAVLDGGALQRTEDGGATWRAVPADGTAALEVRAALGVLEVRLLRGYAALDADGTLGAPGPQRVPVERVDAPPRLATADAERVARALAGYVDAADVVRARTDPPDAGGDPVGVSLEIGQQCEVQARTGPSPARLPTGGDRRRSGWWLPGPTAVARVLWHDDAARGMRIRAVWAGVDDRGFYRAQSTEDLPPMPLDAPDDEEHWRSTANRAVAATRAGLLFALDIDLSGLLWAPAGGAVLPFETFQRADDRPTARLGGAFPLADGTLALLVHETEPNTNVALVLGPDGVVRRVRTIPPAGSAPRALAWMGGHLATATVAQDRRSVRLAPWDDAAATASFPLREPVAPCRGSPSPGAARFFVTSHDGVGGLAGERWSASQVTYVATPQGVCAAQVAGTTAQGEEGRLTTGMVVLDARPDGTLGGFADDGLRRAAVRCRAVEAPAATTATAGRRSASR